MTGWTLTVPASDEADAVVYPMGPPSEAAAELAAGDWWDENVDAPLERAGITPPSWWEEPTGPDPLVAKLDRLALDLAEYPDSPTLTGLAILDADGRPVGMGYTGSPLETAYTADAPASLIVEAERLAAFIGQRGDPGYLRRSIRMAHGVRSVNRRLRRYSGLTRTLATVTVRGWLPIGLRRPEAIAATLAAAEADASSATSSPTRARGRPSGVDPPPAGTPATYSILRTGPPASPMVRPRQAAPVPPARRTHERWAVSRAA